MLGCFSTMLRKIVAAHGNMDEAHVVGTQKVVDIEEVRLGTKS